MATEIRNYGEKKTVVVFTDEEEVINKLRSSARCQGVVPYEQRQKTAVVVVAADLYFPARYRDWLKKQVHSLGYQN